MRRCPYCGKEYPDEATVCAVDQQALIPNADSASSASVNDEGRLPPQVVLPVAAWLLVNILICLRLGIAGISLLGMVLGLWAAIDCSKMQYRGSRVLGIAFKPVVVFAVCAFFLWGFGFVWYLVMRHRVLSSSLYVEGEGPNVAAPGRGWSRQWTGAVTRSSCSRSTTRELEALWVDIAEI